MISNVLWIKSINHKVKIGGNPTKESNRYLEKSTRQNQNIINDILQSNGYEYARKRMPYSEKRVRGWFPFGWNSWNLDGPRTGPPSKSSITSVYPGFFYCVQESPGFFYKLYNYFFSERFEEKEWTSWTHVEKAHRTYIIEKSEGGPEGGQRWTRPTFDEKKQ